MHTLHLSGLGVPICTMGMTIAPLPPVQRVRVTREQHGQALREGQWAVHKVSSLPSLGIDSGSLSFSLTHLKAQTGKISLRCTWISGPGCWQQELMASGGGREALLPWAGSELSQCWRGGSRHSSRRGPLPEAQPARLSCARPAGPPPSPPPQLSSSLPTACPGGLRITV